MLSDHPTYSTLPAQDMERAKSFYQDKVGLKMIEDLSGGAIFAAGDGTRLLVFPSGGAPSGTHTQTGFEVPDIEAEVADLKSRGVVFEEYDYPTLKTENSIAMEPGGGGRAAWFKDTEGNLLGVFQRTS